MGWETMKNVRIAVIGVGGMGSAHCRNIQDNVNGAELVAVCDIDKKRADDRAAEYTVQAFYDSDAVLKAKVADAIVIATPHYAHTTIGAAALKAGYHVLVEKPISVHKADCERLIKAYTNKRKVFSAMFQMRTSPVYRKVKELVEKGELGELTRVNWICTNWFRSQAYYDGGGWRATWAGEGGGVLLNQCPHNLDMLQWITGMPSKIMAHCHLAKYHRIEVEDDVTAYLEYPNGATGVFVASTGDAPGSDRLELTGDRGKLVVEHGQIRFTRNEIPTAEFCRTTDQAFAKPTTWQIEIPPAGGSSGHAAIFQNFVDTIKKKAKLIAPATEGIRSVEIGNAMLYSSLTGKPVDIPMNGAAFERKLKTLIAGSKFKKKVNKNVKVNMESSFKK